MCTDENEDILGKEILVSKLGYWPEFCDAKIIDLNFKPYEDAGATLSVVLHYIDMDKQMDLVIRIVLIGIYNMRLDSLGIENITDRISINKQLDGGVELEIEACAGLYGGALARNANIELISLKPFVVA
ncbi:MAG: immunity 50 family protein [Candidatus Thiodiazotropha sp. (ex Lucinoma kastoroae)]|nr:immunity 50 family protein [Candidatus Thiodiazotropha sp. (ex Lucinoma kastoroae)]